MFDREKIEFNGAVIVACLKVSASLGSDAFADTLFAEFKESGSNDVDAWLRKRLEGEFKSMTEPPRWVESEPDWLFYEGRPMVFMSQTQVPFGEVSDNHLLSGATVYLFGIRDKDSNKPMIYRTVDQYGGLDGTGYND